MLKAKRYFSFELFFWIVSLGFLAVTDPHKPHFSFCIFNQMGLSFCPGCGIGHSISYLLHGNIIKSYETHLFGTFALLIIVYRIIQLFTRIYKLKFKKLHYGQSILNA